MERMDVKEVIARLIGEHLGVDEGKVAPDTTMEELGADSLDMVELTMAAEEEFNIEIPDDEAIEQLNSESTVSSLCEFITAKLDDKG